MTSWVSSTEVTTSVDFSTEFTEIYEELFDNVTEFVNETESEFNILDHFGPVRDPLIIVIPITIIYVVIFFTGVIGNISTCIVISRNKSMHTATNYYLFSLAISDLLLLVSGLPQEMYFIWSRYPYVFGEIFCILRGLAAETSANATVLTITAFTVERYVAICHPFLSHTMSKLSRAVKLIILVWLVSLAFAIPQALQFGIRESYGYKFCDLKEIIFEHSFEVSSFLFFFTPMTLITVLYVLIGLRLRSSKMMKRESGSFHARIKQPGMNRRNQTGQSSRRVLKMLVAVVVAFFICWAPFHAQRLVWIYGTTDNNQPSEPIMLHIYAIMTYISGILYYVSTTINPLLYNIMSNKFREAFKETLGKCCGFTDRHAQRSYSVLSRSQLRTGQHFSGQDSTDYSGNSTRDDSMFSTTTQKQSIDSMSLCRQPSRNRNKEFLSGSYLSKDMPDQQLPREPDNCSYNNTSSNRFIPKVTYRNQGDVRISLHETTTITRDTIINVRNENNRTSGRGSNMNEGRSKGSTLWDSLHCAKSRPFNTDDKLTRDNSPPSCGVHEITSDTNENNDNENGKTETFGTICNVTTNQMSRELEKTMLQDELTTYMQEIRKREKR